MSPYVRVKRRRRHLRRPSRRTIRNGLLVAGCALLGSIISVALGSAGWRLSRHFAQDQTQMRIACHRHAELAAPSFPGGYFIAYLHCMSGKQAPASLAAPRPAPPAAPAAGPAAPAKSRTLLDRLVTVVRLPFKLLRASFRALSGETDTRP